MTKADSGARQRTSAPPWQFWVPQMAEKFKTDLASVAAYLRLANAGDQPRREMSPPPWLLARALSGGPAVRDSRND